MQAIVSSCPDLQTTAAMDALKTGIGTLAEVQVAQVSALDILCARRLAFLRQLEASAQIQYGITVLGTDNAQSIQAKVGDASNASAALQSALQTAGVGVTLSVSGVSASLSDSLPTPLTAVTSTTPASTAASSTTRGQTATESGLSTGVLAVIIIVCAVLILILLPVGGIMYRKQVQEQRVMDVRKLDDEVNQLETLFDQLTTQVDIFQDKCQKEMEGRNQREFQERIGQKQTDFMKKYSDLATAKLKFVKEEYEPEMLRRQPGGHGDVSRMPSTKAKPPPTLQERIWPEMPVTPPSVVKKQSAELGRIDKAMKETCQSLGEQVRIAFPGGIPELPNPGVLGSIISEPVNASLQQEVSLLAPFTHPLLAQATVKPHGVLGISAAPFTEIPAVVVDPAGWRYVGKTGEVKGAGGAAGAIYDWLGLKKTGGKFPAEVRQHFSANTEEEAETRAKFCAYNTGMYVIHVVGPKIRNVQNALHDLSRTYVNVFDEFCKVYEGPATTSRPATQVLRLLPVSSGIFLQNKKLERYMPEITWSSIALAFGMMPAAQREILRNSSIEVCIFKNSEFKAYEQKLKEKKDLLGNPATTASMLKLTETMGTVPDKHGFDWVRTKNGPSDRMERLACFTRTAHALASQGFILPQGQVKLEILPTILGTEVVKADAFVGAGSGKKTLRHENLTVMEVALKTQSSGKATMAVNAASAYQVGGGVMSGGRHALEETWCTMSTLLPSLQKVQWEDRRSASHSSHSHSHLHQHIPVDACILSPGVQVFRDTSAKGYRFQEQPVTLTGVCSMAMFNMNSRVADSPLDAPLEFVEYCGQVKDKFKAALGCMQKLKATVLVCPDVGCGVFENDPEVMGCLLGEAVLDYPGDMEIIATGKPAFFEALRRTVDADPKLPPRETAPPPATFEKARAPPPPKYAPRAKPKSAPAPSIPSASDGPAPVAEVSPVPSAKAKAPAKSAAVPATAKADPKAKPKAAAS